MNTNVKEKLLRSIDAKDNSAISDMSVDIRNQYKEISPLIFWSKWVDNDANVVSIGNSTFAIMEEGKGIPSVDVATNGNRLKTVTVGARCAVSNSLLNKSNSKDYITRAFAIGTVQAIENILFYGNPTDTSIKTITSTGTVIEVGTTTNVTITQLIEMYKALDSTSIPGAIWSVSKKIEEVLLNANSEYVEFCFGRMYFMGLPVFVSDNFSEDKGIVCALVNPYDVTVRCTVFDEEQGFIELSEISANNNVTDFLSIFDCSGIVDKKNSAIIMKVIPPVKAITSKSTKSKLIER